MSLYDVLGARPDASAEELRKAFVGLARRYHPDRHVGAEPAVRRQAERKMAEITEAWSVLSDPQRRRHYDLGLGDPVARGNRGRPPGGSTGAAGAAGGSTGSPSGRAAPGGRAGSGGSAPGARGAPRSSGAARPGAGSAAGDAGRHWRSFGGPGPGTHSGRSTAEQLLLLSPVLLLFTAGLFGMAGAIIGWPPFYAAALVCLICAAAAFFMLPIWAMTRGRSRSGRPSGRGPKRSY